MKSSLKSSLKANFPTELRTDTCVLPSLRLPVESEFNIGFFMCCCLQALCELPGHAKDIVILLALYREVAVQQGMWARNQLDVCCVFLIWYLKVVQDPSSLINLFAKFLEHVLSCKAFTLSILIDSAKTYQWSMLGHDWITSWLSFYSLANHHL